MKKLLLSICAILVFTFVSCGGEGNSSEETYTTTDEEQILCPNCYGNGCYLCNGYGYLLTPIKVTHSTSGSNISFKSVQYGRCNSGCGCEQYVHAPGQSACLNCAANKCTTNKFGHKH